MCDGMTLTGLKVKGRGHDEHRICNPKVVWQMMLPAVFIAVTHGDTARPGNVSTQTRFFMMKHYRHLDYSMIAAGFDIERGEVVCQGTRLLWRCVLASESHADAA